MSQTVHYADISEPTLVDIVDEEWLKDKLSDDGALVVSINS